MFGIDADSEAALGILPGTTGQVDPASAFPIAGDTGEAAGTGTGRYGINPQLGSGANFVGNAFASVWGWLNQPFQQPWTPVSIFWGMGTVLVILFIWGMIFYHIRIAGEAI